MTQNHIKHEDFEGRVFLPCPECGERIVFKRRPIKVNCESENWVYAEDFLQLLRGCTNPFCGWSKVSGLY